MDAPRLPRLALMRLVVSPIIPRAWVARACWCLGSRRSSAGYTETGIVGKTHLDITTTVLYQVYQVIRMVVPCCAVLSYAVTCRSVIRYVASWLQVVVGESRGRVHRECGRRCVLERPRGNSTLARVRLGTSRDGACPRLRRFNGET